jgi:hypothetical protein
MFLKALSNYLLIASGLIHGLLVFGVDVFAHMKAYPHLEMLIMPLMASFGLAAVFKLIRCIALSDLLCGKSCCPCPSDKK